MIDMVWAEIDSLLDRVFQLENDSHPPVAFLTCDQCYAAVIEENWDSHVKWHERNQ